MRQPVSRSLFDLLREQAERHPQALAVVCDKRRVTFAELESRTRLVAGALQAIGVQPGDFVALLLENRLEWVELCFAAAALGATLVPFSTWSRRRELEFLLSERRYTALFLPDAREDHDFSQDLAGLHLPSKVITLGAATGSAIAWADFLAAGAPLQDTSAPGERTAPTATALILHTSGSTAYPKAVPLLHGALIENGFNIGERQGLVAGDRVLLPAPLFWSYGSANALMAAFTHAAALVLQRRFDPGEALDLIERHQCTSIYTLPAMTNALVLHPAFAPERTRSLRKGMTIGSPRDVETAANVLGAIDICNIYGQTESYGNCCVTWHHWPLARRMAVQGPPLPGVQLRLADATSGQPAAVDEPGLLEVRGYVMPGYVGTSAASNAEAFTSDGWFRTGDLVEITDEGDLRFLGRATEMIKRNGINISPAEVEDVLRVCPGVAEVGVVGVEDVARGQAVVAFVVPKPGTRLEVAAVREFCRLEAASYKTPDQVVMCAALPLTPTGKLQRSELKKMAAALGPIG